MLPLFLSQDWIDLKMIINAFDVFMKKCKLDNPSSDLRICTRWPEVSAPEEIIPSPVVMRLY